MTPWAMHFSTRTASMTAGKLIGERLAGPDAKAVGDWTHERLKSGGLNDIRVDEAS